MKTQRTEPMLTEHTEAQRYQPNSLQLTWNNRMGFIFNKYHYTEISEHIRQDTNKFSILTFANMTELEAPVDAWANKKNPSGWTISRQDFLEFISRKSKPLDSYGHERRPLNHYLQPKRRMDNQQQLINQ